MPARQPDRSGPAFHFRNGGTVDEPDELIRWCESHEQEAVGYLLAGDFAAWFADAGRDDLVQATADAIDQGSDPAQQISLFIGLSKIAEFYRRSLYRRFTFLLVGRTGVGKSSAINALLGKPVAPPGRAIPPISTVAAYDSEVAGIPCRVVDTPGLGDGADLSHDYLSRLHEAVGNSGVDCLWFVTPFTEVRVRPGELTAIGAITKAFGPRVWERSVVVLTFADHLRKPERYPHQLSARPGPVRQAIAEAHGGRPAHLVGAGIAQRIPFVAVSGAGPTTPDGRHWLGHLYVETLGRMSVDGFGSFYLGLIDRVEQAPSVAPRSRPVSAPNPVSSATDLIAPAIIIGPTLRATFAANVHRGIERGADAPLGFVASVKSAYTVAKKAARAATALIRRLLP